ncbi:D-ribose pyranase [Lachnospiraceae bacterium 64-25]|nr:D-ribose pyranase [Lachnospiraceae bacterium]
MQKYGILNAQIRSLLARTGHRDWLAITDAGYNIPLGIEVADLAFLPDIPTILQVLDGILDEFSVEKVYLSDGIHNYAPSQLEAYEKRFQGKCPIVFVKDEEMDDMMKQVKGAVRTGNYGIHCPNIIIQAGCTYDE